MRDWIHKASRGEDLSRSEAAAAMRCIAEGRATDAQIAGFLVALRTKGETVEEIAACAEVMREKVVPLGLDGRELVDVVGTGGDGSGSLNVSTLAALVLAGEGVKVAKHGNRSVSSRCGSADLLEALGVRVDVPPAVIVHCLEEAGIAFLFAPRLHPAMAHAVRARRELGVRTVFNLLGPLTNPAGAARQLIGVYDGELVEKLAKVMRELGSERAMVVHGEGGLDEISLAGPTRVAELVDGSVRAYELRPEQFGLTPAPPDAVRGGTVEANSVLARGVLRGEAGPAADIVALNAGAALAVAGAVSDVAEGVERARRCLTEGRAAERLERLCRASWAGDGEEP